MREEDYLGKVHCPASTACALRPQRSRRGGALAGAVTAADLAASLTGNWAGIQRDPAGLLLPAGLLPIGLFGLFVLFVLVTVVPLLRTGDAARPRQLTAAMVMISGASGRNGLRSQRP
jgi:hypothetical protein